MNCCTFSESQTQTSQDFPYYPPPGKLNLRTAIAKHSFEKILINLRKSWSIRKVSKVNLKIHNMASASKRAPEID